MLSIRPNSRQIPSHIEYTSSKLYNDILYGYLQSISILEPDGSRSIKTNQATASGLESIIGAKRQTISKYLKGLIMLGLMSEKVKGKYYLYPLAADYAKLVPLDVLNSLIETKTTHILSLYVYLMGRYFAANQQPFGYKLNTVKDSIGISSQTYSNSDIVTNIMDKLNSMDLIKYKQHNVVDENGVGFKTVQTIYYVKNL